ncbi:MAG TPA: S41 family peptidase [Candidatus Paceibacterota bacterium]|nr:S41 family peptidase [Candidatus Paceibacterota bacterium]
MKFLKNLALVSILLVVIFPLTSSAETEVRITGSGPILAIDEPNVRVNIDLGLFVEVAGIALEKHIDRDKFNSQKLGIGVARGFLNSIKIYKLTLNGIAENARKPRTAERSLRITSGGRSIDLDLGILIEEIRLSAESGKLGRNPDKNAIVVGMIKGFLGSLDRYSYFATNKEEVEHRKMLDGKPEEKGGPEPQTVACGIMNISGHKVGIIKIVIFDKVTQNQYERDMKELLALNPEYLIYDLRDNPGGYLQTVGEMLAMTVGKGKVIFSTEEEPGKLIHVRGTNESGEGLVPSAKTRIKKIVCLINRGTASSGEIMTAGLKDVLGARLVGERTYGKGTALDPCKLKSGRGVCYIVAARWYTPSGKCVDGTGIIPDVMVRFVPQGTF